MGVVLVTLAVGLSLAIPAWLGLPERDVPTVLRPLPLPTLVAAFYFVDRGWSLGSVTVLPSILFFLWHAMDCRHQSEHRLVRDHLEGGGALS